MSVSVVIPTDGSRPEELALTLASVAKQSIEQRVDAILITLDASEEVIATLEAVIHRNDLETQLINSHLNDTQIAGNPSLGVYTWAKVSHQRNIGIQASSSDFVAHLDHDNQLHPDHLGLLAERIRGECKGAHSWRNLLWEDGTAFDLPLYPWPKHQNRRYAEFIYAELERLNVVTRGSNQMRDSLYGFDSNPPLLTVDSSEWFFERNFQLALPFREKYTFREVSHGLTGDYIYCQQLVESGAVVETSQAYTLDYFIGGESTRWMVE